MADDVRIELATTADIASLMRVRFAVRENRLSDPALVSPEDVRAMIVERGRGWVARRAGDERVVGFAIGDLRAANVWALFVEPEFECRGLGRRLHDAMMAWMFAAGSAVVWLSTDPGTRAAGFYRAMGWRHVGAAGKGEIRFEMSRAAWEARALPG